MQQRPSATRSIHCTQQSSTLATAAAIRTRATCGETAAAGAAAAKEHSLHWHYLAIRDVYPLVQVICAARRSRFAFRFVWSPRGNVQFASASTNTVRVNEIGKSANCSRNLQMYGIYIWKTCSKCSSKKYWTF